MPCRTLLLMKILCSGQHDDGDLASFFVESKIMSLSLRIKKYFKYSIQFPANKM